MFGLTARLWLSFLLIKVFSFSTNLNEFEYYEWTFMFCLVVVSHRRITNLYRPKPLFYSIFFLLLLFYYALFLLLHPTNFIYIFFKGTVVEISSLKFMIFRRKTTQFCKVPRFWIDKVRCDIENSYENLGKFGTMIQQLLKLNSGTYLKVKFRSFIRKLWFENKVLDFKIWTFYGSWIFLRKKVWKLWGLKYS